MTQEENLLLTKDLCTRLPYRVKCYVSVENCIMELTGKRLNYFCFHKEAWGDDYSHEREIVLDPLNDVSNNYIVKPYLRPLSSMIEEEKKKFKKLLEETCQMVFIGNMPYISASTSFYDWLNAHHFDYRGLIEKSLAIEAPEGMYN